MKSFRSVYKDKRKGKDLEGLAKLFGVQGTIGENSKNYVKVDIVPTASTLILNATFYIKSRDFLAYSDPSFKEDSIIRKSIEISYSKLGEMKNE